MGQFGSKKSFLPFGQENIIRNFDGMCSVIWVPECESSNSQHKFHYHILWYEDILSVICQFIGHQIKGYYFPPGVKNTLMRKQTLMRRVNINEEITIINLSGVLGMIKDLLIMKLGNCIATASVPVRPILINVQKESLSHYMFKLISGSSD